jgi:hypothetical protein
MWYAWFLHCTPDWFINFPTFWLLHQAQVLFFFFKNN